MRLTRWGATTVITTKSATITPRTVASLRQLIPDIASSVRKIATIAAPVPISRCKPTMISKLTSITASTSARVNLSFSLPFANLVDRYPAMNRTVPSLRNSAGWKETTPSLYHRQAPNAHRATGT